MTPQQFEKLVGEYFQDGGYVIEHTPSTGDYGVDIFATRKSEKIAIQCKMYGNTTRKVNRAMIMELRGAKEYFGCTAAILATDGLLLPDAAEVADKLNISVLDFGGAATAKVSSKVKRKGSGPTSVVPDTKPSDINFDNLWEKFIIPLQGKTLTRSNGDKNVIVKADWAGIERITSNGNKGKIKIEIFKYAVNRLLSDGFITRDDINQNYVGRASSGVILILSQVPIFDVVERPMGLKFELVKSL